MENHRPQVKVQKEATRNVEERQQVNDPVQNEGEKKESADPRDHFVARSIGPERNFGAAHPATQD